MAAFVLVAVDVGFASVLLLLLLLLPADAAAAAAGALLLALFVVLLPLLSDDDFDASNAINLSSSKSPASSLCERTKQNHKRAR